MSDKHTIRSGFRVVGPNTANYKESTWYFPSIEEAERFCRHIAEEVDAEYDIFKYVGTIRQVPLAPRPIEFVKADDSERAAGVDLKPCEQSGAGSATARSQVPPR